MFAQYNQLNCMIDLRRGTCDFPRERGLVIFKGSQISHNLTLPLTLLCPSIWKDFDCPSSMCPRLRVKLLIKCEMTKMISDYSGVFDPDQ